MRCPREVTPHLSPIINVALLHIRYDPNYSYGDDEDGDDDVDMDGEDDEEVTLLCWRGGVGGDGGGGGDVDGRCLNIFLFFCRSFMFFVLFYGDGDVDMDGEDDKEVTRVAMLGVGAWVGMATVAACFFGCSFNGHVM